SLRLPLFRAKPTRVPARRELAAARTRVLSNSSRLPGGFSDLRSYGLSFCRAPPFWRNSVHRAKSNRALSRRLQSGRALTTPIRRAVHFFMLSPGPWAAGGHTERGGM